MPEGDTLHKIANRIGPLIDGRSVVRLSLADRGEVVEAGGWTVTDVGAVGKHLLIGFDSGWTLRTHLGMNGRVFEARTGRSRVPRNPTFLLGVGASSAPASQDSSETATVVCVRAYRAELLRTTARATHARLSRLGPDLLAEPPDIAGALERALQPAHAHREIADLLLDQRIASGIGNVYKSEVLFLERIHPRTTVGALDADRLRALFEEAARLLRFNLRTRRRTTVPTRRRPYPTSPRLWVYERGGDPCLECGTKIRRFTQGDMARGTWYCPTCQPDPTPGA